MVKMRRFTITFLLLVNSAALVLAILTILNASELSDVTNEDVSGASGLLVIAQGDAFLTAVLAMLGIAGNLVLGYFFLGHSDDPATRQGKEPRITGE